MKPPRTPIIAALFAGMIVVTAIGAIAVLIIFTRPGALEVGQTVQASVVIVLVLVTIVSVVISHRISSAALEQAKATGEQAEATRKQLGRAYQAEFIAHVIDPFIEQVMQRTAELMSSRLGWVPTGTMRGSRIPRDDWTLFKSHEKAGDDQYFFPHAPWLDGLPSIVTGTGLKRFHELPEAILQELETFTTKGRLWRQASSSLALRVVESLDPLWKQYPSELASFSQNTTWNLQPYVVYIVCLSLVRPHELERRFGEGQEKQGNTPEAQAARFYIVHRQEIAREIEHAKISPASVKAWTTGLDRSVDVLESRLYTERQRVTTEFRLEEEYILGFREREMQRVGDTVLIARGR